MAQICLRLEAGETSASRLEAALAAVAVACVFIDGRNEAWLGPLIDLAQKRNVAALLVDQVALAKRLRADGVHLGAGEDVVDRIVAARRALGEAAIVGAECAGSRHLAMEIGEAGADYVAFGPEAELLAADQASDDAPDPPMSRAELVAWWSSVFEVPCLALAFDGHDTETADALGPGDFAAWEWPRGLSIPDGVTALHDLVETLSAARVEA